jgi:hypothetical protein
VINKSELARLIWRLERDAISAKGFSKSISKRPIEITIVVKKSDTLCRFPGFDNDLLGANVKPLTSLLDKSINEICPKRTVVFLAELKLDLQSSLARHLHNFARFEGGISKALTGFDARHANFGTKVKVGRQFALRSRYFKWTTPRYRRHLMRTSRGNLPARCALICYHPAGHRQLQD